MPKNQNDTHNGLTYAQAGVDIEAGNKFVDAIKPFAKATNRPGAAAHLGGFGGLFDLKAAGFQDPILVAANDGVGTKIKIAIETGVHNTIGIDLVAMCVNDLIVQGAEPLFFLDYFASGKLEIDVASQVVEGISQGCQQAGTALIGGETAEMPDLYADKDYDLAGFSVGAVERGDILPRLLNMKSGDILIGLASSGVHSNGYSLVRKIVRDQGFNWTQKAPFDDKHSLGETFLTPTRIYVKPLLKALKHKSLIQALAHITGGGLTENIPRVLPNHLMAEIDLASFPVPNVFEWLKNAGQIQETELLRTFNCGIGMVLVVSEDNIDIAMDLLKDSGEECFVIGKLKEKTGDVSISYINNLKYNS